MNLPTDGVTDPDGGGGAQDPSKGGEGGDKPDPNDITKHPNYQDHIAEERIRISKELDAKIKGRILNTEAKVPSFAELKRLVELGRRYDKLSQDNDNDDVNDPDDNDKKKKKQKNSPDIEQILKEKDEALKLADERTSKYKESILKQTISTYYLECGGIPNTDEMKAQDMAVNQLLATGMFEVDDSFNVGTAGNVDIKQTISLWLKNNHIFLGKNKVGAPSNFPDERKNTPGGTLGNNAVVDTISSFLND